MNQKLSVTAVAVTHDMISAYKIADRIALLHDGVIHVVGTPEEIRKQQIDSIKNEVLQKTVCDIKHIIFEYDELINDNIKVSFNYNNIIIEGDNKGVKTKYILQDDCWIEKTENVL